jgi:uncharacterized membrane protein YccC
VRVADDIACLAAVLLAIGAARLLGAGNVGWAAFSAYMVMRASWRASLQRAGLRVLGTAAGAGLAWLLAPVLLRSIPLLSLALALVGGAALYLALLDRRGYGWLFVGLTFAMALIDSMEHANAGLDAFAHARLVEVCVGSAMAVPVLLLGVCIGVLVGRRIEQGAPAIGYVGTQCALAVLVVLEPDSYAGLGVQPGLERLLGMLVGMVLLQSVRLLFRLLPTAQ